MARETKHFGSPAERFTRRMFTRIITNVARTTHENDLSVGQLALLYLLDERTQMRVNEVAAELGRAAPATSRLVDDLVRQGFVERREDENDRRARILTLSEAGHAFVVRSSEARVKTIAEVARTLPADALAALTSVGKLR